MQCPAPSRLPRLATAFACSVLLTLASTAQTPRQSLLPPSLPTGAPPATNNPVSQRAGKRADVSYRDGLLSIAATNASLNGILREVGRVTGMKISGGVAEDRVFGTYGPAPATEVLTALLDGTSSNLLIVEDGAATPTELILTPRQGGPSPPNPSAANVEEDGPPETSPQLTLPQAPPNPFNGGRFQQPGPPSGALPTSNGGHTGTPVSGGADLGATPGAFTPYGQTPPDATAQGSQTAPAATPPSDISQPQSPNGVATPQQIYQQLQQLRQRQQQQPPTPPAPTTTPQ